MADLDLENFLKDRGQSLLQTSRRYSGDAHDADEAYQRTLEILLTRAPEGLSEPHLFAWAMTVARNEALLIARQKQRDVPSGTPEETGALEPLFVPAPEDVIPDRLVGQQALQALEALTPDMARVLLLRADDQNYADIQRLTGFSYAKVNRLLSEGRKAMVQQVGERQAARAMAEVAANTAYDLAPVQNGRVSEQVGTRVRGLDRRIIEDVAKKPDLMRSLSPRDFERYLAELYAREGFEVELTQQSRDGGADLVVAQISPFGKIVTLVEAKRYAETNPVGVALVRSLYGVVEQRGVNAGVLATTSRFTRGAKEFEELVKLRLSLKDFDELTAITREIVDNNRNDDASPSPPSKT